MSNIAVILAGGTGSRLGDNIPKQFLKVAGKSVIEHTIDVFESHAGIDEIAVVIHPLFVDIMEEIIVRNHWKKLHKVLKGGDERYKSSLAAIEAFDDCPDANLIFHDAVRPLVTHRIIDDVITALNSFNAVDVAISATDTIIRVDDNTGTISDIPVRRHLRRGQTPQAFKQKTIKEAYRIALRDPDFTSTDDCGTVVKYLPSEKVRVVKGEESNIKLTYKEDAYLLDKLFQLRSAPVSFRKDFSELSGKVIVVFGGNSGIGAGIIRIASENGAVCHSFSRSTTHTDISSRRDVREALDRAMELSGKIDYVIDTAAILVKEPLNSMKEEVISEIIGTNYTGMVNIALESYPYLKASCGGLLLFTSSSYTRGRALYSLYSSTKAAAVNFMQAISQEWYQDGIKVNAINPERTRTPMRTKNFGVEPAGSLLNPDKVAEDSLKTILSGCTGQVIDVRRDNERQ